MADVISNLRAIAVPHRAGWSPERKLGYVHDKPKGIAIEFAQILNDGDSYILDALVMQSTVGGP